ncbi:hypothetical protein [Streptomyces californicus]|uniref:hypothetical protein n=1 Tax=Streptomyces californicus TaxID=67351 RepID=UPI0004C173C8|nr:hypothetical protein [Streptomyces californicus]QRV56646.1 hypothetical protein I6J40_22425 [Streptomyces californicus]
MPDTSPTPADQLRAAAELAATIETVLRESLPVWWQTPPRLDWAALAVARQLLGTTVCGPVPDSCGDEPCANHEREQAHAEGEHAFCGAECAAELTADEAREMADDLNTELYQARDALAFVGECCDIADREQRPVTTGDVREWLKGARCGRRLLGTSAGEDGRRCVCGDPIEWMSHPDGSGWIHRPGSDTRCLDARPAAAKATMRRLAGEDASGAHQTEQAQPDEPPTEEQIIREHVTTVHLLGEQLAGVESWLWQRLADARDATTPAVPAAPEETTPC